MLPKAGAAGRNGCAGLGENTEEMIARNNPANMKQTGIPWQGMIPCSGAFVCFSSLAYGYRAMFKDLWQDYHHDGYTTIRQLITDLAPPSENNTAQYIANVSSWIGKGADQQLTWDWTTMRAMARAITRMEHGVQNPPEEAIRAGWEMAGFGAPPTAGGFDPAVDNYTTALLVAAVAAALYFTL